MNPNKLTFYPKLIPTKRCSTILPFNFIFLLLLHNEATVNNNRRMSYVLHWTTFHPLRLNLVNHLMMMVGNQYFRCSREPEKNQVEREPQCLWRPRRKQRACHRATGQEQWWWKIGNHLCALPCLPSTADQAWKHYSYTIPYALGTPSKRIMGLFGSFSPKGGGGSFPNSQNLCLRI